jgi:stearoyl-CoA desaturase (delta-9 desaturase)
MIDSEPVTSPSARAKTSAWRLASFVAFHALAFAALWTGVTRTSLLLCAAVFTFQLFSVTIGYHRYFSHRAFKTSRAMQFLLGFCAQTSVQKGVLWWASHHRYHHAHSDEDDDLHSPRHGVWWSYAGWIFDDASLQTRHDQVRDFERYPELRALNRFQYAPAAVLIAACLALGGWSGLVVGFVWGTILSHHATFANNCFAHIFGTRRYETADLSRNNWFLAVITFGEGWHNNHHRYASSARHGFMWWELDPTYLVLLLMRSVGLVWELRLPPRELLEKPGAPAPAAR